MYKNSFFKNKDIIVSELRKRYSLKNCDVLLGDSLVLIDKKSGIVIKVPARLFDEELYVLKLLSKLGINSPKIIDTGLLYTEDVSLPYYRLELIGSSNKFFETSASSDTLEEYYTFLNKVLTTLKSTSINGFGQLTFSAEPKWQFRSEKEFFLSQINKIISYHFWSKEEMDYLMLKLQNQNWFDTGVLVHNDLFLNILFSSKNRQFYIIDPQTTISSANEYWDLSHYTLYANAFNQTSGLANFIKSQIIRDWEKFIFTAQIITYERIRFYYKYDKTRVPVMNSFLEQLKNGNLMTGNKTVSKSEIISS